MSDVDADSSNEVTEGTRRLRAAVRAVMSPGVWLVVLVQALLLSLMRFGFSGGEGEAVSPVSLVLMPLLFLLFVYLLCGAFNAFAHTPSLVSVKDVFKFGHAAFNAFMWLVIKAFLLLLLALNVGVLLTGLDPHVLMQEDPRRMGLGVALISLVFVYWLPIVFVTGKFQLIQTLAAALRVAWRRLPQSGYLALLLLSPPAVAWWLPAEPPFLAALLLSAAGEVLSWIAYVYCIEYVHRVRDRVLITAAPGGGP